jgi:hypothetical protein
MAAIQAEDNSMVSIKISDDGVVTVVACPTPYKFRQPQQQQQEFVISPNSGCSSVMQNTNDTTNDTTHKASQIRIFTVRRRRQRRTKICKEREFSWLLLLLRRIFFAVAMIALVSYLIYFATLSRHSRSTYL